MFTQVSRLALLASALALAACGSDRGTVEAETGLEEAETFVRELFESRIRGGSIPAGIDFAPELREAAFSSWLDSLQTQAGDFREVDLVSARWLVADFPDPEDGPDETTTPGRAIRVLAVVLSSDTSGASIHLDLSGSPDSWTITGYDAEITAPGS